MGRHFVSKKEARQVHDMVSPFGIELLPDGIEVDERKGEKCYFVSGKPYVYAGERVIPTLFLLNDIHPGRFNVTVDDGAVPHIVNGSNVFAQGITQMDVDISAGDQVFIRNTKGQYIAVGIAEKSYAEIMANKKGQVIQLIHYPGDKIMKKFYQ